ncbi:DUF1489 family protein [Palleronia sp.]|uniref:DUF1489 family protein n=1 Tax=Palleronia sp. TaxID=1940284 RepID=UPI0035C84004
MAKVHLIKLSVGSDSVEQMQAWQEHRSQQRRDGRYYHLTRMWPKRAQELLDGGSIYWVIQGVVLARQRVAALEEMTGADGIRRCALFLDPEIVRTEAMTKRPFQGWRYLKPQDAPHDLAPGRMASDALPPALEAALSEIGVR